MTAYEQRSARILMIEQGSSAPPFTLADESGQPVSLADQAGKWVLFWWYPKASTPG